MEKAEVIFHFHITQDRKDGLNCEVGNQEVRQNSLVAEIGMRDDPLDELVQAGSSLLYELCRGRGGGVKNGAFEPDTITSSRPSRQHSPGSKLSPNILLAGIFKFMEGNCFRNCARKKNKKNKPAEES